MVVGHGESEGYRGHASAAGSRSARARGDLLLHRLPLRSAAALCGLFAAVVLGSAPALAIGQRGHVFSFAFGSEGTGEGQFREPSAIAVNDATGHVYVADRARNRIQEFEPVVGAKGEPSEKVVREWEATAPRGIAVDNSSDPADPSRGDVYVAARRTGKTILKFTSTGGPAGELTGLKAKQNFEAIDGITVGLSGELFVYQQGVVDRFNNAAANEFQSEVLLSLTQPAKSGLALDSKGDLYVGVETASEEALQHAGEEGREGVPVPVIARVSGADGSVLLPELDSEITRAVAVNPADEAANDVSELDDVYVTNLTRAANGKNVTTVGQFRIRPAEGGEPERDELIQRFGAPGLVEGSAVAVDSKTGAVYVADESSDRVYVFALEPAGRPTVEGLSSCTMGGLQGAICPTELDTTTINAQVDPTGADTHYSFEYGTSDCEAVPSPCTKTPSAAVGAGFGDQPVSLALANLQPGTYYYRVIAENELGSAASAESSFIVVASSNALPDGREWELVSPPNKDGAEPEPITAEGGLIQSSADGRAITYVADGVMPADQAPEGSRSPEPTQVLSIRGAEGWSSQDLNTPNEKGLGIGAAQAPEYQAFSSNLALSIVEPFVGASGSGPYEHPPLSPPAVPGEEQQKTIYIRDDKPLEPEAASEEGYDAAKHNGELMSPANPGYLALVTPVNSPRKGGEAELFGGGNLEGLEFQAATPDLSHVVFRSWKAAPGLYEWNGPEKPLLPVSVLPGQTTPVPQGALGNQFTANRQMISRDGSRVLWTEAEEQHLYMRDTVAGTTLQLDTLNGGAGGGEGKPAYQTASTDGSRVFFTDTQRLTAGSHAGIVRGQASPDLYVAELSGGGSSGTPLSSKVTDLTEGALPGGVIVPGGVGGGVIGASDDGSYVYFVANGALVPGASRGGCSSEAEGLTHPLQATCNLYMSHLVDGSWTTTLVAVLAAEDQSDWAADQKGSTAFLTGRVSPNGHFLAFMSNRSLTGYDNEDQSSQKKGERLDEEVFLFDADARPGTDPLVCASCNPTGARPVGMFDTGESGESASALNNLEEGRGLLVDRRGIFGLSRKPADHWLAGSLPGWTSLTVIYAPYQSRYLSDEGRLFFNSADALAPLAKPTKPATVFGKEQSIGIENVYEYEPGGLGSCASAGGCVMPISSGTSEHESAFLDASENGNDVFFITAARLAPQDVDGINDVYDAHVCEASAPCLPSPPPASVPCDEETPGSPACRGSQPAVPAFEEPASRASSGPGAGGLVSVLPSKTAQPPAKPKAKPLTRAQKLAKALKLCKKDKQRSKRLACEKLAKKRYGPIKHAPAKKSAAKGTKG
jgi:DNA-binding beta-propeller fold protein YncE